MLNSQILDDYAAIKPRLVNKALDLERQLSALIAGKELKVQSIGHRLKPEGSLRTKIARPDKTYASLWDLTDVVGLRVITYFEDSIDDIAKLIEDHFDVDFANSLNKKSTQQDPTQFGYRSVHYVCRLDAEKALNLPAEARFEIQIRTVLQHAWAEIEHDLGYKVAESIPAAIRRRFSRIAGLLDLADEEFVSIKKDLSGYRTLVTESSKADWLQLPLDPLSMERLIGDELVQSLDAKLAALLGKPTSPEIFFPTYLSKLGRLLGFTKIEDVLKVVAQQSERSLTLVTPYFRFSEQQWNRGIETLERLDRGYSLFFVAHAYVLAGSDSDLSKIETLARIYRELDYPNDEREAHRVAVRLFEFLKF